MIGGVAFYLVFVFGSVGGEMCMARVMRDLGEVSDFRPRSILRVVGRALHTPWMWAGLALLALGFFAMLAMLAIADVSLVLPATALGYGLGALGGKRFLGERVSPRRWAGVLVVALGVALVVGGGE